MDTTTINTIIGLTGAIIVCIVNNLVVVRKMREDSRNELRKQIAGNEAKNQEQFAEIKSEINNNMADMTARLEEIIANQEVQQANIKKDLEYHLHCLQDLDKKVEKHNQVIERTYALEKRAAVVDSKIDHIEDKMQDIEKDLDKR